MSHSLARGRALDLPYGGPGVPKCPLPFPVFNLARKHAKRKKKTMKNSINRANYPDLLVLKMPS